MTPYKALIFLFKKELLRGNKKHHQPAGHIILKPNGMRKYSCGLIIIGFLFKGAELTSYPVAKGSPFVGKNSFLSFKSSLSANLKTGNSLIFSFLV